MYDQVKEHIAGLDDAELVEYVLTGRRMYEADAVAFAKEELSRRNLSAERIVALREPIVGRLLEADANAPTVAESTDPIACPRCGLEAPTRYVRYDQNIGLLAFRISRNFAGHFCRNCNRHLFRRATFITLFLGWWGLISFFITPVILLANLISFLRTMRMPPVPSGALPPSCDDSVISRMAPYVSEITIRLVEQSDPSEIAREIAPRAGVTPGQAWCYIQLIRASRTRQYNDSGAQRPTYGFPVKTIGNSSPV